MGLKKLIHLESNLNLYSTSYRLLTDLLLPVMPKDSLLILGHDSLDIQD